MRQDSLALSDPIFVKAIDDMSGKALRLSLMPVDPPSVPPKDDNYVEKTESDVSVIEKGRGIESIPVPNGPIYVSTFLSSLANEFCYIVSPQGGF